MYADMSYKNSFQEEPRSFSKCYRLAYNSRANLFKVSHVPPSPWESQELGQGGLPLFPLLHLLPCQWSRSSCPASPLLR